MKAADVIVPVYNERENIPLLLQRLYALPDFGCLNLVFVDNASTDGSAEYLASQTEITLIKHIKNRGYGASLRSGMQAAITDRWVIIDADCEYPPECIPLLLAMLETHPVVYASRLSGKHTAIDTGMPVFKWWGNRIISSLYNIIFGQNVTDLYTGCKALRRECVQDVEMQRNGFEQVLEMAVKLAGKGIKITEIPVDFSPRQHGSSKMSHITETVKYFFWLLCYRMTTPRKNTDREHGCG